MLESMRRHAKWFYIFFAIIIVSFVFWGIGPRDTNNTDQALARVGDDMVGVTEYWRAYDNMVEFYRELYKEKFDDKMREDLKELVLLSMVNERLLSAGAKRAGIVITDDELSEAVTNDPSFMRDGKFSQEVYVNTIRRANLTPAQYETDKRRALAAKRVVQLVEDAIALDPEEASIIRPDMPGGDAIRKALLERKRQAALVSFIEGLKKDIRVEIRRELISRQS